MTPCNRDVRCRATRPLGSRMATESLVVVDASVAGEGWKGCDNCASVVIVQEARGVVETVTTLPPSTKNYLCGPCITVWVKELQGQILGSALWRACSIGHGLWMLDEPPVHTPLQGCSYYRRIVEPISRQARITQHPVDASFESLDRIEIITLWTTVHALITVFVACW